MPDPHIPQDLKDSARVIVETKYGPLRGGRTTNGAAVFLEVPYALPPVRFADPQPLPEDYRYEDKDYVNETRRAFPLTSSTAANPITMGKEQASFHTPQKLVDPPEVDATQEFRLSIRKGFGEPSENPLFLNIVSPSHFTAESKFPVTVYIHGGFLQFGSPHELSTQAQYAAVERQRVFINIGYRFSDEPRIDGNFGFKDQWLALCWIRENITAFGGDSENIRLTGLSAGEREVTKEVPDSEMSPVHTAVLQSNAILTVPKTAAELRPQFEALCRALHLDPKAPPILETLRDPARVPAEILMSVIEDDSVGVEYGTFRGCLDGEWMTSDPDPMTWQRCGNLARKLREKGVKVAHPVDGPEDIFPNVLRYYPRPVVEKLMPMYRSLPNSASAEEAQKLMGDILSDGQVHLPVRLFARDFQQAGFPVFRYQIHWTPEQVRRNGLVTHGTDSCLWALRVPIMSISQKEVAVAWLDAIDKELSNLECEGKQTRALNQALTLREDRTIGWVEDRDWDRLMGIAKVLPGEDIHLRRQSGMEGIIGVSQSNSSSSSQDIQATLCKELYTAKVGQQERMKNPKDPQKL
ncbi:Alpha/Beta hydrolase protein [Pisolithus sp. B1]|nr:Alpha/Beta hydrolase protein [Pisolithus sp. B1]